MPTPHTSAPAPATAHAAALPPSRPTPHSAGAPVSTTAAPASRLASTTWTPAELRAHYAQTGIVTAPPRNHNERDLHKAVVEWLTWAVPADACEWFHCPTGEKRDRITAALLQAMGAKPGVGDLVFLLPGGRTGFVELKAAGGTQSGDQKRFAGQCLRLGHLYSLAYSINEVADTLRAWGVPVRAKREKA